MTNIAQRIENLILEEITNLGYEIYDVEYVKIAKDYFLRIYIDNDTGISLDDCEKVSNIINKLLDDVDYIKETYYLEVSSPGIERILKKDKHLKDNIGKLVQIKLFNSLEDKKSYIGNLKGFNDFKVVIQIDSKEIDIDRKNISQIKTIYEW